MNLRRIRLLLLLFAAILWNVLLTGYIEEKALQINCFSYETAYQNFRDHQVKEKVLDAFYEAADADMEKFSELLTMYFATGDTVTDVDVLEQDIAFVKKYKAEEFDCVKGYVYAVWNDLARFPVGTVQSDYSGYSATDGVVEQIGWLRLGGYRIGIRSESGAYFYYAHLAEYAKEFEIGEEVSAGTFLGYMGDTGYSDIPGTTGNFPVHLHFGIYLNDRDGKEFSVNSYPAARYLWERQEEKLTE